MKVYNKHGIAQKNGTSMFPRHLKNHLSSEDNAYLRQVGAHGPQRGLPAGAAVAIGPLFNILYLFIWSELDK
jgi:hypothetical protein